MVEVDLERPAPAIRRIADAAGRPYCRARVLVRLHGAPLGLVDLPLDPAADPTLGAGELDGAIRRALGPVIDAHWLADGVVASAAASRGTATVPGSRAPAAGPWVMDPAGPPCLARRRQVLADPPSVSVVIPVVDRPAALARCLAGLADQSYPAFEVVVVDNAPDRSGADQVAASFVERIAGLRVVPEPRRGASLARNRGLAAASGAVVAFLDGDVRPDRDWLAASVTALATPVPATGAAGSAHAASASAGERPPDCVTGLILPGSLETPSQAWLEEWGGYGKGLEPRAFDLDRHRPAGAPLFPYAIAACGSGASLAMRRADVEALGGFDPALGGGSRAASGEDLALLLDVVTGGGTVLYEPRAIVWHEHPIGEAAFRATLRAYGVGLTAYLTRQVVRHPADAWRIAARIPAAATYFLRPSSGRNHRRSPSFPSHVWRDELVGMAQGPVAYLAGRARSART